MDILLACVMCFFSVLAACSVFLQLLQGICFTLPATQVLLIGRL
jgi:hypothetical protein